MYTCMCIYVVGAATGPDSIYEDVSDNSMKTNDTSRERRARREPSRRARRLNVRGATAEGIRKHTFGRRRVRRKIREAENTINI